MKPIPVLAVALYAALPADVARATPPQPVIRMPQHPGASAPDPGPPVARPGRPCVGDGTGYVRARIRGTLNLDLNWNDAQLTCGGEPRPDGSGLRLSFAGPGPGGKALRLVFGVRSAREGTPGRELPTNLTVLLEGGRVFATRGDDKCTTDRLSQSPLPGGTGPDAARAWRVEVSGFCVAPAAALVGPGRIVVSRFNFAGRIEFSGRG
jgi:hypothetical protein